VIIEGGNELKNYFLENNEIKVIIKKGFLYNE